MKSPTPMTVVNVIFDVTLEAEKGKKTKTQISKRFHIKKKKRGKGGYR